MYSQLSTTSEFGPSPNFYFRWNQLSVLKYHLNQLPSTKFRKRFNHRPSTIRVGHGSLFVTQTEPTQDFSDPTRPDPTQ